MRLNDLIGLLIYILCLDIDALQQIKFSSQEMSIKSNLIFFYNKLNSKKIITGIMQRTDNQSNLRIKRGNPSVQSNKDDSNNLNAGNSLNLDLDHKIGTKSIQNRYICGCGKAYGSYPAFSTHRKTKHQNQLLPGTILPIPTDPKRGRPSYEFKKVPSLHLSQRQYYQGLTSIQLSLLNLDQKFKNTVIRQHDENQFQMEMDQTIIKSIGDNETVAKIVKFAELFTMHMQDQIAHKTVHFLEGLGRWVVQSGVVGEGVLNTYFKNRYQPTNSALKTNFPLPQKKASILALDTQKNPQSRQKILVCNLDNKQQVEAQDFDLQFQIQICLTLSEWMNKIGFWTRILRRRV